MPRSVIAKAHRYKKRHAQVEYDVIAVMEAARENMRVDAEAAASKAARMKRLSMKDLKFDQRSCMEIFVEMEGKTITLFTTPQATVER